MPKFFVKNHQIQNNTVMIEGEDVNHIANVLRLQKQDKISVCNSDSGITYQTEIKNITNHSVECVIIEKMNYTTESIMEVTVFQGLPKADKMEYIIQKVTELGAKVIVPVSMKRCVVKLEGKDEEKKLNRWQKIAETAAKQSGRDIIPKIEKIMKIEKLKDVISNYDLFIVAYEEEKILTLKNVLNKKHIDILQKNIQETKGMRFEESNEDLLKAMHLKIGIMVGPEGGLEPNEVKMLKENGAQVVTLGKRILRTETAAVLMVR